MLDSKDFLENLLNRKGSDLTLDKLHIKNYGEYLKKLEKDFCVVTNMPSDGELRSFISKYNLYSDWKIDKDDVRQDITCQILNSKISDKQKKSILSYKEYLIKLKDVFGFPKLMPEDSEIEDFITEYQLEKSWGITVKDVSEDLEKFVSGEYDELYKDAMHKTKPSVYKPKQQSCTVSSSIQRRASVRKPSYSSTLKNISYNSEDAPQKIAKPKGLVTNSLSLKPSKQKVEIRPEKKKPKLEKTIFIDGDNHFDEGQKGIESAPKNIKIKVFFAQPGAQINFNKKFGHRRNVSSKLVAPGKQAVDKEIKAEVERYLKKGNQDITIVSQDKGFKKFIDKKRNNNLKNTISMAKSVAEKLEMDKKRKNL